ncbi:MAG TPA: hypothetical protein VGB02_11440 [Pyrinomonadaceae bacterium]|jgi:hypothetical protein
MNPLQKEPGKRSRAEIDAEIERLAREQGVEPFDFDAAINDLSEPWTEEDELAYKEFMEQRRIEREADRARQEREWQS